MTSPALASIWALQRNAVDARYDMQRRMWPLWRHMRNRGLTRCLSPSLASVATPHLLLQDLKLPGSSGREGEPGVWVLGLLRGGAADVAGIRQGDKLLAVR